MIASPDHDDLHPVASSEQSLTVPVLVRGSTREMMDRAFPFALFVLLMSFAMLGGLTSPGFCIACLLVLSALFAVLWMLTQRRWFGVTLTGFVIIERRRSIPVSDEQVISVSERTARCSAGHFIERLVCLEIDRGEAIDRIECIYNVVSGKIDPLGAFLDRVNRGLARRTRENFARGAALSGGNWRVDRGGLHCTQGSTRRTYPLDRITRASYHSGHLCLWEGEEERPFLRIRSRSRNVHPLGILLQEAIATHPASVQPLPGKSLGRILLDHHGGDRRDGLIIVAGSLFLFLGLLTFGLSCYWPDPGLLPLLLSVPSFIILVAGIFRLIRSGRSSIRFHEFGVSQITRDGVRELLYTETESMSWKESKEIVFRPRPSLNRSTIHFRSAYRKNTADLIAFRDLAANIIARRWAEALASGPVPWTPRLAFLPGELEYRPPDLFRQSKPIRIPYGLTRYRIENGEFLLFHNQDPLRPVLREPIDGLNFYPGLALLTWIYASFAPPAAPPPRFDKSGAIRVDHAPPTADERFAAPDRFRFSAKRELPKAADLSDEE